MNVWLIQANEPIPYVDTSQRPFRTGMLANQLIKDGHNVVWFAATFDHYQKLQRYKSNQCISISEALKIQLLYGRPYEKHISMKRIVNHIKIAKEFKKVIKNYDKPDIIYCSFPTISLAREAQRYGRQNNIKVIIDVRDLLPEVFERAIPSKVKWLSKPIINMIDKVAINIYKNAFAIHSVSDECVNYVLHKIGKQKGSKDLGYFISYPNEFQVSFQDRLANYKKQNKKIITFVGTLGSQINYDLIVSIAKLLENDCDFIIGGDGPLADNFKMKASASSNIQFKGWLNTVEMKKLLDHSAFSLIPYYNTFDFQIGAGNKFGESLCFALPPIVLCEGVMANLVQHHECGYYSMDAQAIAEYIQSILADDESYKNLVSNSIELYKEKFDSEKIYSDLVKYLENIVEVEL